MHRFDQIRQVDIQNLECQQQLIVRRIYLTISGFGYLVRSSQGIVIIYETGTEK